jgi:hypothetical protein
MADDRYDEGLVHGHDWAREKARPSPGPAPVILRPAVPAGEPYDEGLVHGHAWACGERGRPAGPPPPAA